MKKMLKYLRVRSFNERLAVNSAWKLVPGLNYSDKKIVFQCVGAEIGLDKFLRMATRESRVGELEYIVEANFVI